MKRKRMTHKALAEKRSLELFPGRLSSQLAFEEGAAWGYRAAQRDMRKKKRIAKPDESTIQQGYVSC